MSRINNLIICCDNNKTLNNDAGYHKLVTEIFDYLFVYTYTIGTGMVTYNMRDKYNRPVVIYHYMNIRRGASRFILEINGRLCGFMKINNLLKHLVK